MIEAEEILDPLAVLSHDPRRTWVLGSCLKETWKGQKVLKRVVNWAILALNKIFIKKKILPWSSVFEVDNVSVYKRVHSVCA